MKIKDILNIQLHDIYWILQFGLPDKKATIYDLRKASFQNITPPVFFLSTGRCGTKWFSDLLKKDRSCKILHAPEPTLAFQGKVAYEQIKAGFFAKHRALLKEIYLSAREPYLRYSYKCSRRLIETNNYITFFAPVLAEIFPDAKFVHLYRHPGDFVRSGLSRYYYTGKQSDDIKRIRPVGEYDQKKWEGYTQIQKISWLWNETNQFIESFKEDYSNHQMFSFNFNELTSSRVKELVDFTGADVSYKHIKNNLNKKKNIQKAISKDPYSHWPRKEKEQVYAICGRLSGKYGYKLL